MSKPYVLWLIWQNIETRSRYHVGNLILNDDLYIFEYEKRDKNRGLKEALQNGFKPHLAFPDLNYVYTSGNLFGAFKRRIPSVNRPDIKSLLSNFGLRFDYSDMKYLEQTGGLLATDSYEFVKPVYIHNNKFELEFDVAGLRYYIDEENQFFNLYDILHFELDPENKYDKYAIEIRNNVKETVGYVPAFFSEFLTEVIKDECVYDVKIIQYNKEAVSQKKLKLRVCGELNSRYENNLDKELELSPLQLV